jgi:hypothetical protein
MKTKRGDVLTYDGDNALYSLITVFQMQQLSPTSYRQENASRLCKMGFTIFSECFDC